MVHALKIACLLRRVKGVQEPWLWFWNRIGAGEIGKVTPNTRPLKLGSDPFEVTPFETAPLLCIPPLIVWNKRGRCLRRDRYREMSRIDSMLLRFRRGNNYRPRDNYVCWQVPTRKKFIDNCTPDTPIGHIPRVCTHLTHTQASSAIPTSGFCCYDIRFHFSFLSVWVCWNMVNENQVVNTLKSIPWVFRCRFPCYRPVIYVSPVEPSTVVNNNVLHSGLVFLSFSMLVSTKRTQVRTIRAKPK